MKLDVVARLADEPNVREAADAARSGVDELLWNRTVRGMSSEMAAESAVIGAWCNAAFEGAEVLIDDLRSGTVEASPMGRVAARTLAMYLELPGLTDLVGRAPLQALARMQSVVAADLTGDLRADGAGRSGSPGVGRPRSGDDVDDPLRLDTAAPAGELSGRLQQLARILTSDTSAPAVVVAGVAHAELAVMQPFDAGSGLVARAMTRAVLRDRGVDPDGWSIPETGMRMLGRPKYVRALRGYASGTPEGVAGWLVHHARMIEIGAQEAAGWAEGQPTG